MQLGTQEGLFVSSDMRFFPNGEEKSMPHKEGGGNPSTGTVSMWPELQRRRCGIAHKLLTCFTHLRACCGYHIRKAYERSGVQNKRGEIFLGQTGFIQTRDHSDQQRRWLRSSKSMSEILRMHFTPLLHLTLNMGPTMNLSN